jgi:hypothetical protein
MTVKQNLGSLAPDGSMYVVLADGAGNLGTVTATSTENLSQIGGTTVATGNGVVGAGVQRVSIASDNTAFSVNSAASQSGTWTVQPGNTANTTAWLITAAAPATGTQTSPASSATDVTVLASNASRKGAAIYNDSTQVLNILLSNAVSSSTVFTTKIPASGYYELPMCQNGTVYTGVIKGIWASANGNARVTEWT